MTLENAHSAAASAAAGSAVRELATGEPVAAQVADKLAICEVLYAYCDHLDRMDLDSLAALFTEDCFVDYGPEPRLQSHGAAQLRVDLERMWRWARTSHHLANVVVHLGHDGVSARASSSVIAWHERPDGTTATMMGRYLDELVRRERCWLIARRRQELLGNDAGFTVNINRFDRRPRPDAR